MNNSITSGNGTLVQDEEGISPQDIIDNFFYYKYLFIIAVVVCSAIATIYAYTAVPIYQSDALIQIDDKKAGSMLGALDQVNSSSLGSSLNTEIDILRSRAVIGKAIEKLGTNLNVSVDNRIPYIGDWLARVLPKNKEGLVEGLWSSDTIAWGGESLSFKTLRVPDHFHRQSFKLVVMPDHHWQIMDGNENIVIKGSGVGKLFTGLNGELEVEIDSIKARPGNVFNIRVSSLQSEIRNVLSSLGVADNKRQSSMLRLTYTSSSPTFAAEMLNTISDVFAQQNLNRRSAELQKTLDFLDKELPRLQKSLDTAESKLNEFRAKSRTVDMTFEFQELLKRSTEIETKYLELDLKKQEFELRYDPRHPIFKTIQLQLDKLKSDQALLSRKISQLPTLQQEFFQLTRTVEVNRELFVNLLNNSQQLQIAKAGTVGTVTIIDRAEVPEYAIAPIKSKIISIGIIAGCVLGFLLTQGAALLFRLVRDPKKLEQSTSIPMLAILPLELDQEVGQTSASGGFLLAKEKSQSPTVEAFRSLRTALIFSLSEKPRSKVVLITSAIPGQGKSFISANLAYLFAASGKKVLLVEADIRKPAVLNYLPYDKTKRGLSDLLRSDAVAENFIQESGITNLSILPAGTVVRNPGELFMPEILKRIFDPIVEQFDYVFIDSPPLLPVHDSRTLGNISDVSLFVARQDKVSHSEVSEAIDVFGKSGNKFDGLVFNGFIPSRVRYGYGYGYGYRSYKKYGRYGTYSRYGSYSTEDADKKDR